MRLQYLWRDDLTLFFLYWRIVALGGIAECIMSRGGGGEGTVIINIKHHAEVISKGVK